ncbi:DUF4234 domain-containing protein [Chitinimonas koreensis]|uniref:DUF4234 domain-containing protein n=1 Tax=Chitinimonas koreensis TaxID=356302 RepID=UPI000415C2C5|nr:DUF4234 domain-containing protein [Chitinimonas koreensis]QNM96027.1 DUF4234 domain-containing protein [Chitinimonas koreensis]
MTNPYAATEAAIHDKPRELKYCSVWLMIGLSVVTLSLYLYYWLWTRSAALAEIAPDARMVFHLARAIVILQVVLVLAYLLASVGVLPVSLQQIDTVGTLGNLLWLGWTLAFRGGFNRLTRAGSSDRLWNNLFFALVFSMFYHQYKANQYLRSRDPATD